MSAEAQMQLLGEHDGARWYWAAPGMFHLPGVYYWDGNDNVRVEKAQPAPSPQPAAPVGPKCRDCADFGPICPNSGKPCNSQPQPAVPVVSDEQIDAATRHMYHNGRPTSKEYRVGIVRAILALRPQAVPMTDGVFDLICNAIDKADTITMGGDYMLDSDDCIAVVRVMQALLSVRGITAKAEGGA